MIDPGTVQVITMWAPAVGGFLGSAVAGFLGTLFSSKKLGDLKEETRWQSKCLKVIAKRQGSDPPPRAPLDTLDDPWPEIMAEAKRKG